MTAAQVATEQFTVTFTRPSYTVVEWAEACGIGETTIREHERAGNLTFSYPNSKAIITLEEGMRWLRSLPSQKPERAA